MKILYNLSVCQPVGNVKRHGGGIYGEIVLRRIIERGLPVVCYYDTKRWLNPDIERLIKDNNIVLYDSNKYTLNEVAAECHPNVLYSPINSGLGGFNACKAIFTIHGLRKFELPNDIYFFKYKSSFGDKVKFIVKWARSSHYRKKDYKYRSALVNNKNRLFITVSEHSKYAFFSYYPSLFKGRDLPVFYSPSTIGNVSIDETVFQEKYFLLVSAGIWAKNNLRAIMALDRLFSSGLLNEFCVRVTGVSDSSIFRYKIQHPERFIFMGYVDDDVLHQLFHDAYCLAYPSLNEGFGYPPVEAMKFGVPVIASSFSSISEVCQDAAMYFNPYSIEEITNRILQITDERTYSEYKKKAEKRYKEVFKRQTDDLDGLIDFIYRH